MRPPLHPPSSLSREQKDLYDDIKRVVKENPGCFTVARQDGALIGGSTRCCLSGIRSARLGHEQNNV
jgi:hypothetical protein